jgi:hypothetical protein
MHKRDGLCQQGSAHPQRHQEQTHTMEAYTISVPAYMPYE